MPQMKADSSVLSAVQEETADLYMSRKKKAVIIIISIVALIVAVAAGIWCYKTKFYVPDKDGMVYSLTDTITACRYTSAGGMDGTRTEAEISIKDNGEVWLEYYHLFPFGTDEEIQNRQLDEKAIEDIREICKKHGILGWGELKLSNDKLLDAPTAEIELFYSDNQSYRVNTGYICPDGGEKIFDEILEIINRYKQERR